MSAELATDVKVLSKVGGNVDEGIGLNVSIFYNINSTVSKRNIDIFNDNSIEWRWDFNETLIDEVEQIEATTLIEPVFSELKYNDNILPCVNFTPSQTISTTLDTEGGIDLSKQQTISFFFNLENIIYGVEMDQGQHAGGTVLFGATNIYGLHFTTGNNCITWACFDANYDFSYCRAQNFVFNLNQTYHIALVLDNTNAKIYIDGEVYGDSAISSTLQTQYSTNCSFNQYNKVDGNVGNVRILNRACSYDEVQILKNETLTRNISIPIKGQL